MMATPALRCLRLNFPKACIDVTLLPYVRPIIEGAPWFDNIIELPFRGRETSLRARMDYLNRLRSNQYDMAIILPNSFSSALLAFLSGAKHRIGYARQGRNLLLTHAVPAPRAGGKFIPQPMVDYYLRLCEEAGAIAGSKKTELFVDENSERQAEQLFEKYKLGGDKMIAALAPGAAFGSSKLWNPQNFARLADALAERFNCQVVIVGGPKERAIAREIAAAARSNPANFVEENMSLHLLKSISKRCDFLITVDSGPRHFAVAFDKPVVVLMGATDPRYTNCNLEKTAIVRADNIDCAPCQKKRCPIDHRCMTAITPDMVLSATATLLSRHQII